MLKATTTALPPGARSPIALGFGTDSGFCAPISFVTFLKLEQPA
jgi:hypothetical protein